jgi:hypothetical protein
MSVFNLTTSSTANCPVEGRRSSSKKNPKLKFVEFLS